MVFLWINAIMGVVLIALSFVDSDELRDPWPLRLAFLLCGVVVLGLTAWERYALGWGG